MSSDVRAGVRKVTGFYFGDRAVSKIMAGERQVWPDVAPVALPTTFHLQLTSNLTQTLYFTQSEPNGVSVDWGDGSPAESSADLSAQLAHTWSEPGIYQVSMTAEDGVTWSPGGTFVVDSNNVDYCFLGPDPVDKNDTHPELLDFIFGDGACLDQSRAFGGCTSLAGIDIPNRIGALPEFCFYGCINLVHIEMPSSLTTLRNGAFSGCTNLANIDLTYITTIEQQVFRACGFVSMTIPNSVTSINTASLFQNCQRLESVELPDSASTLGRNCFRGCSALTDIVLKDGITSIGQQAFISCTALRELTIPKTVETIYSDQSQHRISGVAEAWDGCTSLENIYVDPLNTHFKSVDGCLFGADDMLYVIPQGKSGPFTIPSNTKNIYDQAGARCKKITAIIFPSTTITKLHYAAFKNCNGLTHVYIPPTVLQVLGDVFNGCSNLKTVEIACKNLGTSEGRVAFRSCNKLEKAWFRSSCTSVSANSGPNSPFVLCNPDILTIYAEPTTKPSGWGDYWNYRNTIELATVMGQTTPPF